MTVSQLPSDNLAEGQQVAVTELPRVKLETGQAVRVYTTTPMLTKPVGGESIATSLLTITEGMGELIANTSRCHVLLKASSTNIDAVTLGTGWIVEAGEQRKHYVNCCRRLANWSQ
ncbi:hypothetical protein [Photobacterium gaetbulicola]|uniref:hypothetical protein n=1 Tax=Photobacterium gaetbulicola TaxID=1295392 RepID=UPI0006903F36|nr:hypothetical protein [Photobacterium gaetbulicola]